MTRVVDDWSAVADDVIAAVRAGKPIIVPTDTVYGLAACALDVDAVTQLFALKERPADLSIAALVADIEQAEQYADVAEVRPLLEAHWPGALTVVVAKIPVAEGTAELPLGAPDGSVGLRVPAHAQVRALARAVGPLAATSANKSGAPTLVNVQEILEQFGDDLAFVVDEGPLEGQASSVIKVVDGKVIMLREGGLTRAELQATLDANR